MSVIIDPFSRFQRIRKVNLWQRLPAHFRRDVVGLLDYKSRGALRRTSRKDKALVDSCPVHVKSVAIVFVGATDMHVKCWNCPRTTQRKNIDDPSELLLRILKHPKSEIGRLDILAYLEGPYGKSAGTLKQLCNGLEALSISPSSSSSTPKRRFPIKAKYFRWTSYSASYPTNAFQTIMSSLDPQFLNHVVLNDPVLFERHPTVPEQLKLCKMIEIGDPIPFQEFMLCPEKLMVKLSAWSADDVVRMVKSFRARHLPLGSFFDMTSTVSIRSRDIFNKLQVPAEPMHNPTFRRPTYAHRFKHQNDELELVLVSYLEEENTCKVTAVVCRKEKAAEDFKKMWECRFACDCCPSRV